SSSLSAGTNLGTLAAKLSSTSDKALGSVVTFQEGTLTSNVTLTTSWRERNGSSGSDAETSPSTGSSRFDVLPNGLFSDVVDVSGIDGQLYVMTLTYNVDAVNAAGVALEDLKLGYFNSDGKWVNAVFGNS